jgi:hypothetical protein
MQDQDPKLSTGFAQLDNVIFDKDVGLVKRWGYEPLSISGSLLRVAPTPISGTTHVTGTFNDIITGMCVREKSIDSSEELVLFGSSSVWSYEPTLQTMIEKGERHRVSATSLEHYRTKDRPYGVTSAEIEGIRVTGWASEATVGTSNGTKVALSISDALTGQTISPEIVLVSPDSSYVGQPIAVPRVTAIGDSFWIVYTGNDHKTHRVRIKRSEPTKLVNDSILSVSEATGSLGQCLQVQTWKNHPTYAQDMVFVSFISGSDLICSMWNENVTLGQSTTLTSGSTSGGQRYSDVLGMCLVPNDSPITAYIAVKHSSSLNMQTSVDVVGADFGAFGIHNRRVTNILISSQSFTHPLHAGTKTYDGGNFIHSIASSECLKNENYAEFFVNWRGSVSGSISARTNEATKRFSNLFLSNRLYDYVTKFAISGSITSGSQLWMQHLSVNSNPFVATTISGSTKVDRQFMNVNQFNDQQGLGAIVDSSGSLWAVYDVNESVPGDIINQINSGTTTFNIPVIRLERKINIGGISQLDTGLGFILLNFEPKESNSISIGSSIIRSDGLIKIYDGSDDVELGYLTFPSLKNLTLQDVTNPGYVDTQATALITYIGPPDGAGHSDGKVKVNALYSWVDANGLEHRSRPGTAINGSYALNIILHSPPTISLTEKENVKINIFRTAANSSTSHLINSASIDSLNDKRKFFVDIPDDVAPTTLFQNEIIYTDGGELPPDPVPNSHIMTIWDNRVWLVDDRDGLTIRFSKEREDGLGPEFPFDFAIVVDPKGGRVTALGSLDNALIIFKNDRIFSVTGQGPNVLGTDGNYVVNQLSIDVGCTNHRAICNIGKFGICFLGNKGIYNIDRGLNTIYIGAPVEDEIEAHGECVSATYDVAESLTRFTFRDGTQFVLDLKAMRWTRHTLGLSGYNIDAATIWNGKQVLAIHSGSQPSKLVIQTSGSSMDVGSFGIPMEIKTPWIRVAGNDGMQRVNKLTFDCDIIQDFTGSLGVQIIREGKETSYSTSFETSGIANVASGTNLIFEHDVRAGYQENQGIRVSISDVSGSTHTLSKGFRLRSIMLTCLPMPGVVRLPKTRRIP